MDQIFAVRLATKRIVIVSDHAFAIVKYATTRQPFRFEQFFGTKASVNAEVRAGRRYPPHSLDTPWRPSKNGSIQALDNAPQPTVLPVNATACRHVAINWTDGVARTQRLEAMEKLLQGVAIHLHVIVELQDERLAGLAKAERALCYLAALGSRYYTHVGKRETANSERFVRRNTDENFRRSGYTLIQPFDGSPERVAA